jgi:hypothetical protein
MFSVNSCPKITHLFWWDFIKTYTIMSFSISHRFFVWKISARRRKCFLWDNSCGKTYTILSAVLRQQRKSDVMTSFGHSARSTVYCKAVFPLSVSYHHYLMNVLLQIPPIVGRTWPWRAKTIPRVRIAHYVCNECPFGRHPLLVKALALRLLTIF